MSAGYDTSDAAHGLYAGSVVAGSLALASADVQAIAQFVVDSLDEFTGEIQLNSQALAYIAQLRATMADVANTFS